MFLVWHVVMWKKHHFKMMMRWEWNKQWLSMHWERRLMPTIATNKHLSFYQSIHHPTRHTQFVSQQHLHTQKKMKSKINDLFCLKYKNRSCLPLSLVKRFFAFWMRPSSSGLRNIGASVAMRNQCVISFSMFFIDENNKLSTNLQLC